jgi:hypothetical protein
MTRLLKDHWEQFRRMQRRAARLAGIGSLRCQQLVMGSWVNPWCFDRQGPCGDQFCRANGTRVTESSARLRQRWSVGTTSASGGGRGASILTSWCVKVPQCTHNQTSSSRSSQVAFGTSWLKKFVSIRLNLGRAA